MASKVELNTITELPLPKWEKRLAAAEKRREFTQYQIKQAGEWGTCAIGESYKVIDGGLEKKYDDADEWTNYDQKAEDLGMKFFNAAVVGDVDKARQAFTGIKKYALRMHKKYNKGVR